jgi:hypothetical protein
VALFVVGCSDEAEKIEMVPQAQGERGESCRARNDCADGLACIRNTCVKNDFPISAVGGSCAIIECTSDAECCPDELSPMCQNAKEDCAGGDQWACDTFEDMCVCDQVCRDNQCRFDLSCVDDNDCSSFGQTCEGGSCVECTDNSQCGGDELCVEGICTEGCSVDANCPLFHVCQDSKCVESGCTTDRECVLFTNNGNATCQDGQCLVACQNDAECGGGFGNSFEVCQDGRCVFVGCETDKECRIALELENRPDEIRAVCEPAGE